MNKQKEKLNLFFSYYNPFVATVAIFISIWAIKKPQEIAERSGAFDKGKLNLKLVDYLLKPNERYEVCYGLIFQDSISNFASFPTGIYN